MAQNRLAPSWLQFNYHSAFGLHIAKIPVSRIVDGINPNEFWLEKKNGDTADVADSAANIGAALKTFYDNTVTIDSWLAWRQDPVDAPPEVVVGGTLGYVGNWADTILWKKATQSTVTFRTTKYGIGKIVLLDCVVSSFERVSTPTGGSPLEDLVALLLSEDSVVRGRDDGFYQTFLHQTTTLNEKLRRAYNMA
jgi:hypothetical protein